MSRLDSLVSCTNGGFVLPGLPEICKLALTRITFKPEEIGLINTQGNISILAESNKELAEAVLPRLIEMGADINAVLTRIQSHEQRWTSLHYAVFYPPWWTELLLKNQADQEITDKAGRTPLNLARELLMKKPDNSDWAAIVRLLEEHKPSK